MAGSNLTVPTLTAERTGRDAGAAPLLPAS
jgi:hypothetical protein